MCIEVYWNDAEKLLLNFVFCPDWQPADFDAAMQTTHHILAGLDEDISLIIDLTRIRRLQTEVVQRIATAISINLFPHVRSGLFVSSNGFVKTIVDAERHKDMDAMNRIRFCTTLDDARELAYSEVDTRVD